MNNKMLPYEEYLAELRKFPTAFRIGVELYQSLEGDIEVLLEERGKDDHFYGGRWALFGSTILIHESYDSFWDRHRKYETGLLTAENVPEWSFCGILETPNTERHHGILQIFGRIWDFRPETSKGVWFPLATLDVVPIVPSERVGLDIAIGTLVNNKHPHYIEFDGTDKV